MPWPLRSHPTFEHGNPEVVFEGRYDFGGFARVFDLSLDGTRFLVRKPSDAQTDAATAPLDLVLVQNWFENQLAELRQYVTARGWTTQEYVDKGVSGARDRRPALDALIKDAKRRRFDVLVCWRLDRLGRNLRHLILLIDDLQALGVAFVSLAEGIDATTPAGRLQLHVLGAIAEFERARIAERVKAGLTRAKANGTRLGRPLARLPLERLAKVHNLSHAEAARSLGVSLSTVKRWRREGQKTLVVGR